MNRNYISSNFEGFMRNKVKRVVELKPKLQNKKTQVNVIRLYAIMPSCHLKKKYKLNKNLNTFQDTYTYNHHYLKVVYHALGSKNDCKTKN